MDRKLTAAPQAENQSLTPAQQRQARLAGIIGNVVEWYDFALYGYLAVVIGKLFFPAENPTASLLASYGVFAAGFVMRPVGAAVFGWLGDTIGRGRTMLISVAMMAFPTIALGLLPDYQTIGIAAPILLILIRLVQGLSVGGEFSSSVTYLVETAPDDRRGRAGSWANVGSMTGMLLGSAAAALVTSVFQQAAHEAGTPSQSPFKKVWTKNRKELLQAFLFAAAYGMTFYLIAVYLPGWLARHTAIAEARALQIHSALTALIIPLMVLSAWVGDVWVRRTRLIAVALAALAILVWPLTTWMMSGNPVAIIVSQLIMFALLAVPLGSAPAMFVELFPSSDRLTGYSISFNLGIGVLGGATPGVATWLIGYTGNPLIPVIMTIVATSVATVTLLWMTDRSREPLK